MNLLQLPTKLEEGDLMHKLALFAVIGLLTLTSSIASAGRLPTNVPPALTKA